MENNSKRGGGVCALFQARRSQKELLFLSLTPQPWLECLDLLGNPQWSHACRQSAACLFFMLLLGLNTCRPVPTFFPCTCLVTFDVLRDKNQILNHRAPSSVWVRGCWHRARLNSVLREDGCVVCSISANLPLLCYLSSALSQDTG